MGARSAASDSVKTWSPDLDHIDIAAAREAELRDDALAALKRAMHEQLARPSLSECETCGSDIPHERQLAVPGVHLCVGCQEKIEMKQKGY